MHVHFPGADRALSVRVGDRYGGDRGGDRYGGGGGYGTTAQLY